MEKFVDIDRAIELIISNSPNLNTEKVRLEDSFNRILASPVYTKFPVPNFNKSPFDGYCLKSQDTVGASVDKPVILKVAGVIKAGDDIRGLDQGIYKIMTGAEVPDFCDFVIKKEDTDCGDDFVKIFLEGRPGQNIIKIGEDVPENEKIIDKGTIIKPGVVAMLAALGISEVEVYKIPKVGLITSGDEVIELGSELKPGKIYNSNKYALLSFLNEIGIKGKDYGVAVDDITDMATKFNLALDENDVIITTGGVSVGDFDFIQEVYDKLNVEKLFWGVKMKPGTPVLAGKWKDKIIISLPGSPAASLITYEVIGKPVLKYLMGSINHKPAKHYGLMMDDFKKTTYIPRFLRVMVKTGPSGYEIHLSGKQNAGVLHSMLHFNALAKINNHEKQIFVGDKVEFSFISEDDV